MESRNERHWRVFVHDLLYFDPASTAYDGVRFINSNGTTEFAEGCLAGSRQALQAEIAQIPTLFAQLSRRAVLLERDWHEQQQGVWRHWDDRAEQQVPLTPALELDGTAFQVMTATPQTIRAVSRGRERGLIAQQLHVGVLVVALRHPMDLEAAFESIDRACAMFHM